jgi:hypothetical protein
MYAGNLSMASLFLGQELCRRAFRLVFRPAFVWGLAAVALTGCASPTGALEALGTGRAHAASPSSPSTPATSSWQRGDSAFGASVEQPAFSAEQLWSRLSFAAASINAQGRHRACFQAFGRSRLNAPLWGLKLSDDWSGGQEGQTGVMLLAQQHGDETDNARVLVGIAEMAADGDLDDVLKHIDLLIVPRLNPDGVAVGRKTNEQGIDIDDDHLLLRTPAARALAQLVRTLNPAVFVELRSMPPVSVVIRRPLPDKGSLVIDDPAVPGIAPLLARAAREWFRDPVAKGMSTERRPWYDTLDAPTSMYLMSGEPVREEHEEDPNTLSSVMALRNIVSLQLWRSSSLGVGGAMTRRHAEATDALRLILKQASARASDLRKLRHYVRRHVAEQACHGAMNLGVEGAQAGDRLLRRPCGYWLAAEATDAVARLRTLGLTVNQLEAPAEVLGDDYLARAAGADTRGVPVRLKDALIDMPAGSFHVPLAQPLANLAIMALEPNSRDGYLANGIISDLHDLARLRKPLSLAHDELAMPMHAASP